MIIVLNPIDCSGQANRCRATNNPYVTGGGLASACHTKHPICHSVSQTMHCIRPGQAWPRRHRMTHPFLEFSGRPLWTHHVPEDCNTQ